MKGNLMIEVKNRKKIPNGVKLFLMTLPFLILYFLFCYLPVEGIRMAFYDYEIGKPLSECEFVGVKWFVYMFNNPYGSREALRVIRNTLTFTAVAYLTCFVPMFFAIFLNEIKFTKLKKFIQTVTTIPHFISWVIGYSLVFAILAPDTGALNILLMKLGIIDKGLQIMTCTGLNVYIYMTILDWWKGLGWGAIIYLAAINGIDQELYEAAEVDGAGRWQKIWHITIPGLMPTFITLMIMSMGSVLNTGVEKPLLFSNAFNKEWIEGIDLYVYNLGLNANTKNYSYATAVGLMQSVVGLGMMLIANWISGKVRENKIF